ncbi:MAG: response regulator [Opitutus sp.]
MKLLKVLLADDDDNIRVVLKQWLAKLGCAVVDVGSADEARRALSRQTFDLVITDVLMPGGDGIDLIEHVKKSQPETRVLAISGGGRYLRGNDCLKIASGMGAHAVAMKPFTREQFFAAIADAMRPEPKPAG